MSFSGGTKVNFKLKNNLFVTSGIGLSALKVVRNIAISNSSRFNVVDTSNGIIVLEGGHILPTSFSNTGTIFGSATYKLGVNESYSFLKHSIYSLL
ncbi:MAG: hypothetical protein IPP48_10845 [Chitinophagaceae bacterium]|nr:hypothetical protein [Chitinophagaceae bacterium]